MTATQTFAGVVRRLCESDPAAAAEIAVLMLRWAARSAAVPDPVVTHAGTMRDLMDRRAAVPPGRTPSVYYLFDGDDRLAYIGSTDLALRQRILSHRALDAVDCAVRWELTTCRSRGEAFALERREIYRRRPYLNRECRPGFPGPEDYLAYLRDLDDEDDDE